MWAGLGYYRWAFQRSQGDMPSSARPCAVHTWTDLALVVQLLIMVVCCGSMSDYVSAAITIDPLWVGA